MSKERKFDGVWDARRVLYNVLFYADEEGYIKYVAGDAESTDGIKRQRFNAALKMPLGQESDIRYMRSDG